MVLYYWQSGTNKEFVIMSSLFPIVQSQFKWNMLEPSRYLELVRCVVEEGVEGVPLTTHPHVVVERSQLLSDHAMSEHLKKNICGWSMKTEEFWSHPFSFCHDNNVHDNVLRKSNRSPGGDFVPFLSNFQAPSTTDQLPQNYDDH